MFKKIFFLFSLIIITLSSTNASHARRAVFDVIEAPLLSANGQPISADRAKDIFKRAAIARSWRVRDGENNSIIAELYIRKHWAQIRFTSTDKTYNITYVNSQNLNYKDGKIHRNYNNWIIRLDRTFQKMMFEQTSN